MPLPITASAWPKEMSLIEDFTSEEFRAKYSCDGVYKVMFPDNDEECFEPVGIDVAKFLCSEELKIVDDLHIEMKLFWKRSLLGRFGDVQGSRFGHAH